MATAKRAVTTVDKHHQAVAKVRDMLSTDVMQAQLKNALPKHLTPEKMIRVAVTAIQRTPQLAQCSQVSLIGAIVEASQLGLLPDGALGEGYLVPFKNHKTGQIEAQFMPGYRGKIALALRSGKVTAVKAKVVREGDHFVYQEGAAPVLEHRPVLDSDAPIIAAYTVASLPDGSCSWHVIGRKKIDEHRAKSKADKDGAPWRTHFEEMCEKTAVHYAARFWPQSAELMRAAELEHAYESGDALAASIIPVQAVRTASEGESHDTDCPRA
jgi:recombination protein RecT